MAMKFISRKQKELFSALESCDELIFACGPKGISANLVGKFKIIKNHHGDDQLDVEDGTNHVHIDWELVSRSEIGEFHGEGMISFFDDSSELLFKFYQPSGPFSEKISELSGLLV